MSLPPVVIACVAEDRPEWYRMVENLALSIRTFGGRLARARFVAYFVGSVDEVAGRHLLELGAELRVVDRYSRSHPPTNKLRMFEDFAARQDAELLLAMDCDMVVTRDFLDEATPGGVTARPAAFSPLNAARWETLLHSLGLQAAAESTAMLTRRRVPAPYVNSGVLFVPVERSVDLATAWRTYVDLFIAQAVEGIDEPWTSYFLDQIALSCALLDRSIPVHALSPYANFPTAVRLKGRLSESDPPPLSVLHYHKNISAGGLLGHTDSPYVNDVIDRVNRVLAARLPREDPALAGDAAASASVAAQPSNG